mmetsp:Transcript_31693/g.53617  ORF Transcript_31693/g.53617 Transcript_31693/m.53617 type:complete len:327 (-) Transcript_31693:522-1502(-)
MSNPLFGEHSETTPVMPRKASNHNSSKLVNLHLSVEEMAKARLFAKGERRGRSRTPRGLSSYAGHLRTSKSVGPPTGRTRRSRSPRKNSHSRSVSRSTRSRSLTRTRSERSWNLGGGQHNPRTSRKTVPSAKSIRESVEGKPIKGGALSLAARFSELTIKIDRPSPLSYDSKAARDRLLKSSISSVIPTARRFKPDNYDPSAKKDPGPMTYNIEAVKDKLAKSPRRVVIPTSRRFKKKKKEETPGPLTYRVNEAKAKLDKKGARAVIPRAKRGSPLRQRSVSPGPGAYKTAKSKDYLGHQGTGATIDRYKAPGHIRNPRTLTPGYE